MTVESATFLGQLDSSLPAGADAKSEGDQHIRLIKAVLKSTFPLVTNAVGASNGELSYCAGVTSNIQTQLNAKAASGSQTLSTLAAIGATLGGSMTDVNFRVVKDPFNRVSLSGNGYHASPLTTATILTLPAGYRPAATRRFVCAQSATYDKYFQVVVNTDGTVVAFGPAGLTLDNGIYLDGISFHV